MKTTATIYAQYGRLSARNLDMARDRARRAHPATDGNALMVHNWGNEAARAVWARADARGSRIYRAMQRLYAAADHLRHGPDYDYLWCALCQTRAAEPVRQATAHAIRATMRGIEGQ